MAYTTIDDPSAYFQNKAYTGGSGDTAHTFDGNSDMQPDLVWIKNRTQSDNHALIDSVRGSRKWLGSNNDDAEDSNNSAYLASFNSDGFTTSDTDVVGKNGETYASWNWKAGTSFSNDASATSVGTIDSSGSASDSSGFSIVSYTGTGSSGTIKHGLSSAPTTIFIKVRSHSDSWTVGHNSLGWGKYLRLDNTTAEGSNTNIFNNTTPTSTVFSVNHDDVNASGRTYIAYCFADVKGFSKFGSYAGNGNADGPFVWTGFKPAMVICKKSSASGTNWGIIDNKRANSFNQISAMLNPNSNGTEGANNNCDFVSNGFKWRTSDGNSNDSATYIYMAFAENPFVTSTGIPATAR